ncbi:Kinesin light chain 3 [Zalerion maritima]|uniref:Kinesin light chain 3 n=1 Tax=Zalerion maritima TaxID=339359 RepID=A0AAD5RVW6_9PEZI|nr:Kinesin light chain 3 [Zalerion maritima]
MTSTTLWRPMAPAVYIVPVGVPATVKHDVHSGGLERQGTEDDDIKVATAGWPDNLRSGSVRHAAVKVGEAWAREDPTWPRGFCSSNEKVGAAISSERSAGV